MEPTANPALFGTQAPTGDLTVNGYRVDEVKSALQKAIRRGQDEQSMFWARELLDSGKQWALWQRLRVIAVEDCVGMLPLLFVTQCALSATKSSEPSLFAAKAALELSRAEKDRTADDYLCCLTQKLEVLGDRSALHEVPDEALDEHTKRGRQMGRDDAVFFHEGARLENESPFYDKKYIQFLRAQHALPRQEG